ncbi:MAG: AI-2E family transporter [Opitutaceae bacterium]|jgi:predicted PurR-regulated permease PerM|nr:AI-2E family transporter [Opitutaceae bacterium]
MNASGHGLLSPTQRRLVGFALGFLALALIAVLTAALFWALSGLLAKFSGVIWPLAVAGIIALILRPLVDLLETRLRLNRPLAVVILYALFALLVAGVLLLILPPLVSELVSFAAFLPELVEKTTHGARDNLPQWIESARRHLDDPKVKELTERFLAATRATLQAALGGLTPTLGSAGAGTLRTLGFLAHAALIPVYLFFFLLLRANLHDALRAQLGLLKPDWRETALFLVREFVSIVVTFFRSQLLVCLIVGALYGVAFTCVGLKFGLFIGLSIGLLNIVPYLGSTLGLCTLLPLAFFQNGGGLATLVMSACAFALVQALDGWFITPRIMGKSTGLHPLVIIIAIFFWGTALGGLLGVMLAIPLTAFFVTVWRFIKQRGADAGGADAPKS